MNLVETINNLMHRICDFALKMRMKEKWLEFIFSPWINYYFKQERKRWEEYFVVMNKIIHKRIRSFLPN